MSRYAPCYISAKGFSLPCNETTTCCICYPFRGYIQGLHFYIFYRNTLTFNIKHEIYKVSFVFCILRILKYSLIQMSFHVASLVVTPVVHHGPAVYSSCTPSYFLDFNTRTSAPSVKVNLTYMKHKV